VRVLKTIADNRAPNSLATRLRKQRFALFLRLLDSVPRPIKLLDVGGTQLFWERMGFTEQSGVEIVLLNLSETAVAHAHFISVIGDATDLKPFADQEFDIVFSNSVIEHVGTFEDQRRMAQEVRRVGKRYFLQTPNRYFPIEPHFLVPLFQFLPLSMQVFLVRHFDLGWSKKIPDKQKAVEHVRSIRLLTKRELAALFPGAAIYSERFLGLTKSFVAYGGWAEPSSGEG
jgi:hypothetical protein